MRLLHRYDTIRYDSVCVRNFSVNNKRSVAKKQCASVRVDGNRRGNVMFTQRYTHCMPTRFLDFLKFHFE